MPTADRYLTLAEGLELAAETLDDLCAPLAEVGDPLVLAGGVLRDELVQRVDDDHGWCVRDASLLRDAAAVCRDRVVEIARLEVAWDDHAAAMARYRRGVDLFDRGVPGAPPSRPVRPAPPPNVPVWAVLT